MTADRKARIAEAVAIGIASRMTHFTPHGVYECKKKHDARPPSSAPEHHGKYRQWIADEASSAVSPQVGTQPHQ